MVITSSREVELDALEHSRSAKDATLARERERAVQAVLAAVRDDINLRQEENAGRIRISASLTTLDPKEFAALADLLRAHDKGYPVETLLPLLETLARVFRR
jgi:hypothetical protein